MRAPIIVFIVFSFTVFILTAFWDFFFGDVLQEVRLGLYSKDFFENILAGAHGTIIDLLVVGLILYWFEKRGDKKDKIEDRLEALADLRFYRGSDASYKVFGEIRRLMSLGINKFQISEYNLSNLIIENMYFKDCNLHAVDFSGSLLSNVAFEGCECDAAIFFKSKFVHASFGNVKLRRAKFNGAILNGVNFSSCEISGASFVGAELRSAVFKGVDCKGIDFRDADLRSANFVGAKNLTNAMLQTAKNTKFIKL